MTYLRPNRGGFFRRNRLALTIILALILIIAGVSFFMPHVFPELMTSVASPFWKLDVALNSGILKTNDQLLAENESLKEQISNYELRYASSSLQLLEDENRELLALVNRTASSTPIEKFKLAAVLARPSFMPFDEIIIDLGLQDGISSSSLIYSPNRVLIGRVASSLSHTSHVILYSSPHERYHVLIGSNHIPAVASGRGGGQYEAQVPHGSGIAGGDVVIDSILRDRAFGTVISVSTDPSNPFDTVLFAPPINLYSLRFVLVR